MALIGYQVAAHIGRRAVILWLGIASLAFYGYWKPAFLIILGTSILFNYAMASLISRKISNAIPTPALLTFAIVANLAALCYYKYLFPTLNFFARHATGHDRFAGVLLPLGISFFTFTQIAYLVDLQEGGFVQHGFEDYLLFATFFPHLIAGPIIHHAEIMPQFQQKRDYRLRADDLAVGFSWFIMGLLKKVLLADHFALFADPAFSDPHALGLRGAWVGSLGYALQLYFDFSGYSDMALGLARMFSIDFPLNFSSPYKATNIIDFWQRWHMTLTRYINLYIYNPVAVRITRWRVERGLKSSRKAMQTPSGFAALIATPTIVTLFLAGVWHGAGQQFIIFGLLHALYLCINPWLAAITWREKSICCRLYSGFILFRLGRIMPAHLQRCPAGTDLLSRERRTRCFCLSRCARRPPPCRQLSQLQSESQCTGRDRTRLHHRLVFPEYSAASRQFQAFA